ncbi:ribonuclease inhibitor [soil metagenome]
MYLFLPGRFHPLLVHLPIGILLLAFILEWFSYQKKFEGIRPAVGPSLMVGSLSALLSVFTGYLLSLEGGYDDTILQWHQYLGISTAVFSLAVYFIVVKSTRFSVRFSALLVLMVLVTITGHLGGSLTHGEDFLFASESSATAEVIGLSPETLLNPSEVKVFEGIVQPILAQKCYSCHGDKKQKGQLRLDTRQGVEKGGKKGVILVKGDPDESELIKRVGLAIEDKHHMPPRERQQLTFQEVEIIKLWVSEGASFEKRLKEFDKPRVVEEFIRNYGLKDESNDFPLIEASPPDAKAVEQLMELGAHILPVGTNSNYLTVSFSERKFVSEEELNRLKLIGANIVELDLSECEITPELIYAIGGMPELRRLFLQRSNVKDADIEKMPALTNLTTINFNTTSISNKGVLSLSRMPGLRKIYLFQSEISGKDFKAVEQALVNVQIDSGNYLLPTLTTDTLVYKAKKVK